MTHPDSIQPSLLFIRKAELLTSNRGHKVLLFCGETQSAEDFVPFRVLLDFRNVGWTRLPSEKLSAKVTQPFCVMRTFRGFQDVYLPVVAGGMIQLQVIFPHTEQAGSNFLFRMAEVSPLFQLFSRVSSGF
jgi:hypothetical protein